MKTFTLVLSLAAITLFMPSCKKEYHCICPAGYANWTFTTSTRNEAAKECAAKGFYTDTCRLQ